MILPDNDNVLNRVFYMFSDRVDRNTGFIDVFYRQRDDNREWFIANRAFAGEIAQKIAMKSHLYQPWYDQSFRHLLFSLY
jgi:hypothetical protein